MHPARFVDLLFVYSGAVQFIQFAVIHRFQFTLGSVSSSLGMGIIFCSFAVLRMRQPTDELRPTEYGLFVYFLVGFCLVLTVITVVFVIW